MHWEGRLWKFTEGLRWRIAAAVGVGLVGVSFGLLRLAILGWLIGRIFAGDGFDELLFPMIAAAVVMCARSGFEYVRAMMAHRTAAAVQARLRRTVHDKITELGPAFLAGRRSGDITLTLVDGIEQLETYFGKYLPQLLVTFLTPVLIFGFIAFIDLAVASTLLVFALIAIFAGPLARAGRGPGGQAADFLRELRRRVSRQYPGPLDAESVRAECGTGGVLGREGQGPRAEDALGPGHKRDGTRADRCGDRVGGRGGACRWRLADRCGCAGSRRIVDHHDDGGRDLPAHAGPPDRPS